MKPTSRSPTREYPFAVASDGSFGVGATVWATIVSSRNSALPPARPLGLDLSRRLPGKVPLARKVPTPVKRHMQLAGSLRLAAFAAPSGVVIGKNMNVKDSFYPLLSVAFKSEIGRD
jgi:hypothetical protein